MVIAAWLLISCLGGLELLWMLVNSVVNCFSFFVVLYVGVADGAI